MRNLGLFLLGFVLLIGSLSALEPLVLVDYGRDLGLRDRLIGETDVFADLGGRLVSRINTVQFGGYFREGLALKKIGEPGKGEGLAAVFAAKKPSGVTILLQDADFFLVAGTQSALLRLRRGGLKNGGVELISLDRSYRAGKFKPTMEVDAPDPRVAALVGGVTTANLTSHLKALTAIWTRRADRPENAQAINYIKAELAKLKVFTVKTESFSTRYGPNVIAEIRGLEKPQEIVIVGAHLDSTVYGGSSLRSPGADDNGSGSASVLEMARLFATMPMQKTVRFAWWNAEEMGLVGSKAYASAARTRGDRIIAYLNTDMNAYRAPGDTVDVDFIINNSTGSLVTYLTGISKTYVPTLGVKSGYLSAGTSDHQAFFQNGFPAVFYFEDLDKYSPFIHRSTDDMVNSTNDMNLSTLITKSVTAGMASLALPLEAPTFTLNITKGPSVGGTVLTAKGSFLTSTTAVKVGGKSVPFTKGAGITFATPVSSILGGVQVEISNPAGAGKVTFTYTATTPPTLRVPAQVLTGGNETGAVGGKASDYAVTLISPIRGTTNLGVISLEIGGGMGSMIFQYHTGRLSAGGGTLTLPLGIPKNPVLVGQTFYFQACTLSGTMTGLAKTNYRAMAIK